MQLFRYIRPATLAEARASLSSTGRSKYLAGGTTLVDLMKMGVERPTAVVDITSLENLNGIEGNRRVGLTIGALARMSEVARHPTIRSEFPALRESLVKAASTQLRNMATVGGNLLQRTRCAYFRSPEYPCNKRVPGSGCPAMKGLNRTLAVLGTSDQCIANYPGDWAVALSAFDAQIVLVGSAGERVVPISDFFLQPGDTPNRETAIGSDELITAILVPASESPWGSAYEKARDRESYAFALASAAAVLQVEGGLVRSARISVGGIGTVPWRLPLAEAALIGLRPSAEAATDALKEEFADARTTEQNKFRVPLAKAVAVNAILVAASRTSA